MCKKSPSIAKISALCMLFTVMLGSKLLANEPISTSSINLSLGLSHQSPVSFSDDLLVDGYTSTTSTNDSNDFSWKISYQRKLSGNFYGELGYLDLGQTNIDLDLTTPIGKTEVQAAKDIYENSSRRGQGVTLGITYNKKVMPKLEMIFGVGVYRWKDKNKVTINDKTYELSESSTDGYLQIGSKFQMTRKISIIGSYEHYLMPGNDVDRFSAGLNFSF